MSERQLSQVEKRRFNALKRGIHRIAKEDPIPVAVHVVGLGKAGANVIEQILQDGVGDLLDDSRTRFTALAIDIGDEHLAPIRKLSSNLPADQSQVRTYSMEVPSRDELFSTLAALPGVPKVRVPSILLEPQL